MSFFLASVQAREWNRVAWQTVMMLVCVYKQAMIKTISDALYSLLWWDRLSLSLSLSFTHTQATIKIADSTVTLSLYTQYAQNTAFEQRIANT